MKSANPISHIKIVKNEFKDYNIDMENIILNGPSLIDKKGGYDG